MTNRQPKSKKPRGMTHEEISEIVLGQMYRRRVAYKAVKPDMLVFPYDHAVAMLQKGITDQERIRAECGNAAVDAPLAATENLRDGGTNWLSILEKKYNDTALVRALREEADKIEQGRDVNAKRIHETLMRSSSDHQRPIRLDTIPDDQRPFIQTGLPWLDEHVGGLPTQGLILVTAPPKTGKTSLGIQFCKAFAAQKRESVLYSLEMTDREVARRAKELLVPPKQRRYISIKNETLNVADIAYHIAREQWTRASLGEAPVELVVIDFADLMIEEETNESETAAIYRGLSDIAKKEMLPVVLFAQPNRSWVGGICRPNHTRYSGMAEAMSKLIFTLHNPCTDFTGQANNGGELPAMAGRAYICVWATREGFRIHKTDNPGAIPVSWDGEMAWGAKSLPPHWIRLSGVAAPPMERRRK